MMLRIDIITAFPTMMEEAFSYSMVGRAMKRECAAVVNHDLRKYATDKHRTIDDTPYGGGGGMILQAEPIFRCVEDLFQIPPITSDGHIRQHLDDATEVIMLSPQGEVFTQKKAVELSLKSRIVFISGHYKGIDERVHEKLVTQSISMGDFVCSGGEYPVMVMVDAIVRLIPGVLSDAASALSDSFQDDLLDCPYYTKPEEFRGMKVPNILLSGNHADIQDWREKKKKETTQKLRPDLWNRNNQT